MRPPRALARAAFDRDDCVILAAAAGVALFFVLAELRLAGELGFPLDDAWIHLRFADNLARGRGFGINPGEPVAGSTAPLWTLLLALPLVLGVPGLVAGKAVGFTAYVATGLVTRRLAAAVGLGRGFALAAGIAVVGLGRLAWGGLSGMEVPLAALLVATAAFLVARDRPLGAAATLGLATLARPEAGLLVTLHVFGGWGAGRLRAMAARAAVAGAVLAPALLFNLATVGRLMPATAVAKVQGGLLGRLEGTTEAWSIVGPRALAYLREWGSRLLEDHWALPALAVVGLVVLRRHPIRWLAWAALLHPIAVALVAPYAGPAFQTGRYSSHLVPLVVVLAMVGLAVILEGGRGAGRGGSGRHERRGRAAPPGWRVAVVLALALPLVWGLPAASVSYAWGVQNINAMQVRLGHWVAGHTPPAARLAINDIGALTYFGDRWVTDLVGLATPEILPYRRQGMAGLLGYLERACPDYLIIFPTWFPALAARGDLFRPIERVRVAHNVVSGGDEMVVYETVWNRWGAAPRPCPA